MPTSIGKREGREGKKAGDSGNELRKPSVDETKAEDLAEGKK